MTLLEAFDELLAAAEHSHEMDFITPALCGAIANARAVSRSVPDPTTDRPSARRPTGGPADPSPSVLGASGQGPSEAPRLESSPGTPGDRGGDNPNGTPPPFRR